MVEETIVNFKEWLNLLGVVPVISALRDKALVVQAETMQSIERKMPNLSDRERKVLNKHTKSIINQLLKDPILQVKELAALPDGEEKLELFMKIFNLEEQVKGSLQTSEVSTEVTDWTTKSQPKLSLQS